MAAVPLTMLPPRPVWPCDSWVGAENAPGAVGGRDGNACPLFIVCLSADVWMTRKSSGTSKLDEELRTGQSDRLASHDHMMIIYRIYLTLAKLPYNVVLCCPPTAAPTGPVGLLTRSCCDDPAPLHSQWTTPFTMLLTAG